MSSQPGGYSASFPTTIWSLVENADHEQSGIRTAALEELLRKYAPAMVAHLVRRKRMSADRAADLVQGFIADKVLEKGLVGKADQNRGKFRTLLLTALDRYIVSDFRAESAQKRGGGRVASLEGLGQPTAGPEAEADAFDVAWARSVLDQAIARMKDECTESKRPDIWGIFNDRLLGPTLHREPPPSYEDLVSRYGIDSPAQASNLLITGKRMFARTLRSVIADYATDDQAAVQREMDDLMLILARQGAS